MRRGIETNNTINLPLDKSTRVQQLNEALSSVWKKGKRKVIINAVPSRTYSNVCAPIAGVIEYYRSLGMEIYVHYTNGDYVRHTRFWNPLSIEKCNESEKYYPFDKVWTFETSEGVGELVDAYILDLRKNAIINEGVTASIEWCLNEVMDNVLQHSQSNKGYVMAQIHKQSKVFAFCVFDAGIGFYNSLKNTKHHPEKPIDAITLALQEKITRDESIGQGNGLWGLSSIVLEANGQMEISSNGAKYKYSNGRISTKKEGGFVLSRDLGTSYLDVRIEYDRVIDIAKALGGYTPSDLWLESLEEENGNYRIAVAELSSGTGTRQSAIKLRNLALNISKTQKTIVVFDFSGVNLVSSSFADELIGKLISENGFYAFIQAFRIINVSQTNAAILNRSVEQRMAQKYFDEIVNDFIDKTITEETS